MDVKVYFPSFAATDTWAKPPVWLVADVYLLMIRGSISLYWFGL
jgi:hypothetical protein